MRKWLGESGAGLAPAPTFQGGTILVINLADMNQIKATLEHEFVNQPITPAVQYAVKERFRRLFREFGYPAVDDIQIEFNTDGTLRLAFPAQGDVTIELA